MAIYIAMYVRMAISLDMKSITKPEKPRIPIPSYAFLMSIQMHTHKFKICLCISTHGCTYIIHISLIWFLMYVILKYVNISHNIHTYTCIRF